MNHQSRPAPDLTDAASPATPKRERRKPDFVPYGLTREEAARHISVSASLWDQMVADGRMPRPKQLSEGRIAWSRPQVELAFENLPDQGDAADLEENEIDKALKR